MSNLSPLQNGIRVVVFGSAGLLFGMAVVGWFEHQQAASVPAVLQAKTTAVTVGQPCRLMELFVAAGEKVSPGQPLIRLGDERLEAQRAAKARELVELRSELLRAEAAADVELSWRRREIEGEIYETQQQAAKLMQERLHHQVEQLAWEEHLQGLASWSGRVTDKIRILPLSLSDAPPDPGHLLAVLKEDAAATAAESLSTRLELCEKRLSALNQVSEELNSKVRVSAGVDVAKTRVTRAEEELALLDGRLLELTIASPGFGTVGVLQQQPGDLLQAGDVVLELLDEDQLSLTAMVPSSLVGQLNAGQNVELMFPGTLRRSGRVATLPPQTTGKTASDTEDTQLSLQIQPAGKLWPKLPMGTRVAVMLPKDTGRH